MKAGPKIARRRSLWLLVPAALVAGLVRTALRDPYADFERKGTPVSPSEVLRMGYAPYISRYGGVDLEARPSSRTRAWLLHEPLEKIDAWLVGRGFQVGVQKFRVEDDNVRFNDYINKETEEGAAALDGPKLPNGASCVLLVQEPTGVSAAWRRFVGRLRARNPARP